MLLRPRDLMWTAALAATVSAQFVLNTALVNRVSPVLAVAAVGLLAALIVTAVSLGASKAGPAFSTRDRRLAALAGVLGVWLAPLMVAANRHTDAPSGTEVLFFTTAAWGLLLVAGGLIARTDRPTRMQLAGGFLGLVGSATILANWERPSSFSPLVKFPGAEIAMLLAGVAWVVFARLTEHLVRRYGPLRAARAVVLPGAGMAVLAGLIAAPRGLGTLTQPGAPSLLVLAALVGALLIVALAEALTSRPPHALGAVYFLPAVLLTGLTFVERATGAFGPAPILWAPVLWGSAVSVVAVAIVAGLAPVIAEASSSGRRVTFGAAARAVAMLALVTAAGSLLLPDISVSVTGSLSTGQSYHAEFVMLGFETVGGWLAVVAGVLVILAALRPVATLRQRTLLWAAGIAVVLASWAPLHTTPMHVWNRWIPPEVQQDYGTEYALIELTPQWNPAQVAALTGEAIALALMLLDGGKRVAAGPVAEGNVAAGSKE